MNSQKSCLLLIILLAFSSFCFGQEKTNAVLLDEFPKTNCDDLSAHLDNFFIKITNTPNAKSYVVIYGDKNQPTQKYVYENMLKEFIKFFRFDESRINFLHGKDDENLRTQFWTASENSSKPIFDEQEWNYVLPRTMKPKILHANSWIGELCPTSFSVEFYSKFLTANPDFRGHLVIYENSLRKFRKAERDLTNQLTEFNVPRHQFKFFFVERRTSDVEFWLVPGKNK